MAQSADLKIAAPASRAGSKTLPPDLLAEASRRLPRLGLFFVLTYLLNRVGQQTVMRMSGTVLSGPAIQHTFDLAAIILGVAVFVLARSPRVTAAQKLSLSRVFLVLGALVIALTEFWLGFPVEFVATSPLIPAECLWIVAFPLIVPNCPVKVLKTSLLAASMGPLALAVSAAVNDYAIERPGLYAVYFLCTSYVSAVFAYPIANIVYRFGTRLKMAREIGSYELLEHIGEGGMGQVWRGRHRLLARPAAIKLIRNELLGAGADGGSDTIRRFEREAQQTASLGSVHTIDVYDYGVTEDGDFYYVMELLKGISLERYVGQFGPMPPARVVYLLKQACHSLSEAHSRGLIHRDIKPANIFLCRLGPDDDFVKVLDFGLVQHFGDRPAGSMPTIEEITAGTPGFMAPEIILSDPRLDGRADIYGLGCVAYYLLTGTPVFSGESVIATMLAHVRDTPSPVSARARLYIPPALDRLILDCLAKNRERRPASVDRLAQRLEECPTIDKWNAHEARRWWRANQAAIEGEAGSHRGDGNVSKRCWPSLDHHSRVMTSMRTNA